MDMVCKGKEGNGGKGEEADPRNCPQGKGKGGNGKKGQAEDPCTWHELQQPNTHKQTNPKMIIRL